MIVGVPAPHFLTWAHVQRRLHRARVRLARPAAISRPSLAAGVSTGGYAIPAYIVQCESGGDWRAVNPVSGAGGAYQIMPATWTAYGGVGLPEDASPVEQSRIAARIWASVGPSAWSCK